MATSKTSKKSCVKCDKGGGVFTCDGCQQSFCRRHTDEHRQELAMKMDEIGQEYDIFQRDVKEETNEQHPFLLQIDTWERESIQRIKQGAEQARTDLQALLCQKKKDLETSVSQLTSELRTSQDAEDYTEFDLTRWTDLLKELRCKLDTALVVDVTDAGEPGSTIRLIKVHSKRDSQSACEPGQPSQTLPEPVAEVGERFQLIDQEGVSLKNGLEALCLVSNWSGLDVHGTHRYSNGIHHIRFRVEHKMSKYLFFGITIGDQASSRSPSTLRRTNGWWDFDCYVRDGVLVNNESSLPTVRTGDELTLMLDCDNRQIHLRHHRTQQTAQILVNLQICPFPWQLLVTLNSVNDCVHILENNG